MKRSEMIDIMWKFIQNIECDYDVYMKKTDTEDLLDIIEKAGMKPPMYEPFSGKILFQWEPEDEEK